MRSDKASRQRSTVPLDEDGESSAPTEMSSIISLAHTANISEASEGRSQGSRRRRRRSDGCVGKRGTGAPMSRSGHSKQSQKSLSLDDIRKGITNTPGSLSKLGHKTPSSRSKAVMIGNTSAMSSTRSLLLRNSPLPLVSPGTASQVQMKSLPDLVSLEQALHECGEDGLDQIIRENECGKLSTHMTKTPVIWKTSFEVDAPRETPSRTPRSCASVVSEPDPILSEEQGPWAGIDELLETQSFDDSFCFSTSDILPKDIVRAMRKENSFRSIGASISPADLTEDDQGIRSKRSLESISKTSSSSSSRGTTTTKERKTKDPEDSSVVEELWRDVRDRIMKANAQGLEAPTSPGGNLFDMFHWSEKDNVDEQRRRKTKLNSRANRVTIVTDSGHESGTCSLPSLATIRADDVPRRALLRADSFQTKGSVVTENTDFSSFPSCGESDLESDTANTPVSKMSSNLAGDGLILDKGVDEYIRKIQGQLPTISEDGAAVVGKTRRKKVLFMDEGSPSPTSVAEESPFDDLPSLTTFSGGADRQESVSPSSQKIDQKKEPKQSISFQLKSQLKKMKSKVKAARLKLANGDEEKYFPDAARPPAKSKGFNANRCLLSDGGDGINWD